MYLRLLKYTNKDKIVKDNEVNKAYVWFTLRSVYMMYLKEKSKIDKIRIGEDFDIPDDSSEQFELKRVYSYIDRWEWYDKMLFTTYINSDLSIRQIAKETGISLTSVFYTIKNCKQALKKNINKFDL